MDSTYPAVRRYIRSELCTMGACLSISKNNNFRHLEVDRIYGRRIAYAQLPAPVNFAHFSDYCAKHLDEYIW